MKKTTKFLSIALVLAALAAGAILLNSSAPETEWEVPAIQPENTEHQAKDRQKSDEAAKKGWELLADYLRSRDESRLKSAAREFNRCREADSTNFQSYRGWAVISGIRAEQAQTPGESETRRLESHGFFKQALACDIPEPNRLNLKLDLGNACNGLGAFYQQSGDPEKAREILAEGNKVIESVLTEAPENGKAHFLMSANFYYQGNPESAKHHAAEATKHRFLLPAEYQSALEKI